MISYKKGYHPGALWKKCDFQIHTPRDHGWSGGPSLPGGSVESEAKRSAWADLFIAACLDRGLTAIAITDHHDHALVRYVQQAVGRLGEAGRDRIWAFPGMEITCNDSCQCIVLFDVNTDDAVIGRLFSSAILRNVSAPDPTSPKTIHTDVCGCDLETILVSLAEDPILNNKTILLPHGGNDASHKTIFRKGFHTRYASLAVDGVYATGKISDLKDMTLEKIRGKAHAWGPRRRGLLLTSDSRDASFAQLGESDCWIRLGEPTAEAVRQALLADEARIVYEQPHTPSQRVVSLRVSSMLCGHDFTVLFNEGLTCLIGGRGSGKSALLEYLRFGLGRSARDTGGGPIRDRERELIEDTLLGGDQVAITLVRDGSVEIWVRTSDDVDEIRVQHESGEEETITPTEARRRFRGRAYYQKQLSTLMVDAEKASEQITSIAAAEFVDQTRAVDADFEAAKRSVGVAVGRYEEFCVAETHLNAANATIADIKRRIFATEALLDKAGLSEADRSVLIQEPIYGRSYAYFKQVRDEHENTKTTIVDLTGAMLRVSLETFPGIETFKEVIDLSEATKDTRTRITQLLDSALTELNSFVGSVDKFEKAFETRSAAFKEEHAGATQRQTAHKSLVDDLARLNRELSASEDRARGVETHRSRLANAPRQLSEARKELALAQTRRRSILEASAAKIAQMSDDSLRAGVVSERIPREYVDALSDLMKGARIRHFDVRVPERGGWDAVSWAKTGSLFIRLLSRKAGGGDVEPDDACRAMLLEGTLKDLNDNQQNQIFSNIDITSVSKILTASSVDSIQFEYQDRDKWIDFGKASPGQQASAVLDLLLRQQAGTLIIDQPEEDLDNRKIMDIAKLIQRTKQNRQLIFATHNANIAVNGDADKIVALVPVAEGTSGIAISPRIDIEVDGAIETPGIKDAVTHTMEGGKDAFELRRRKYAFSR